MLQLVDSKIVQQGKVPAHKSQPTLETIPSELLSNIALHLSLQPSPLHPPSSLLPLLLSSKHFNTHLSLTQNPRLYSRIFQSKFDTSAISRRFGLEGTRSRFLAGELKRRTEALERLGLATRRGDVSGIDEVDLWVPYLMIVENDGKNLAHLLTPTARLHLPTFIKLYHEQQLVTAAIEPGYPPSTTGRALALWIGWLLSGFGEVSIETDEQVEERLFVLRPYVFAAQHYNMYFAPWTVPHLPLSSATPSQNHTSTNPFIADLSLKANLVEIPYGDQTLNITAPNLSQAATLRFFLPRDGENHLQDGAVASLPPAALFTELSQTVTMEDEEEKDPEAEAEAVAILAREPLVDEEIRFDRECVMSITNSKSHDRDFKRLTHCWDPQSSVGMSVKDWRGSFDGCWEGTFSFFDFDAFREMLSGQIRALYSGPYGEQAQVWRIKETFVRKIRSQALWKRKAEIQLEPVPAPDDEVPKALSGPALNAGFTSISDPAGPGLATAAAEAETLKETIKEQVEALDGYEEVPEDELDEMCESQDWGRGEDLTMLLTGTGHSSWGRFVLKGKVRVWDGMATLVKQYSPDGRGRWIYRGYVLAGGLFVGRWRDTFTPEEYVGYEGTFNFSRRKDD